MNFLTSCNPPLPLFLNESSSTQQYTLKIKIKVFPNEKFAHKITQHVNKHVQ